MNRVAQDTYIPGTVIPVRSEHLTMPWDVPKMLADLNSLQNDLTRERRLSKTLQQQVSDWKETTEKAQQSLANAREFQFYHELNRTVERQKALLKMNDAQLKLAAVKFENRTQQWKAQAATISNQHGLIEKLTDRLDAVRTAAERAI